MAVKPVVSLIPESAHVMKSSAAVVFGAYAINLTSINGWMLLLDQASVGADGAVTPLAVAPLPAGGTAFIQGGDATPIATSLGACLVLSSAATPFTQTTSGGLQGYLSCQVQ